MKEYMDLSMKGEASIPERERILSVKKDELMEQMQKIRENRTVNPCFLLESI